MFVSPGDKVADLGCGFGVLGLICLQAGASEVWGIDRTDAIEIARETMDRAGFGERYHCIRDSSFRATLPQPVDLLVCDHVGFFGINYGIVAMFADARRRLLKPGGRIAPRRIRLIVAGAVSQAGRTMVEAWSGGRVPGEYAWLREYAVNTGRGLGYQPEDIVTEPVCVGTIDLAEDQPAMLRFEARLPVVRDAEIDGLAGWFECELADGIWMTNSPLEPLRIDRDQLFLGLDKPAPVRAGDSIDAALAIYHETALMNWRVSIPGTSYRARHSDWNGLVLNEADRIAPSAHIARLNRKGEARRIVLDYVDGVRTHQEIEQAVLRDHPDLFPAKDELRRFVKHELSAGTER